MANSVAKKSLKTIVFLGSVRENRMGLRVAKFMVKQLQAANHTVELFDPLEIKAELLVKPLHHYSDRSQAPKWLIEADKKVQAADSYVIVSAEYNHTIPPALANLMDHFPASSFAYKPSAIVCYSMGPFGGMRAAMTLRCFLGELGCISVSNIFGIPQVQNCFDADGKPLDDRMVSGAQRLISQLDWHAHAMANQRLAAGVPS